MLEDEDAPEEAEDEPIEQSRLNRTVMLRNVFWRAGGNRDALDEQYARELPHRADQRQRSRWGTSRRLLEIRMPRRFANGSRRLPKRA